MAVSLPMRWSDPRVVLVATDLGDLDRLMPHVLAWTADSSSHLILLHVIATDSAVRLDGAGAPVYDAREAIRAAQLAMQPWCEVASARRLDCVAMVREGEAAAQILSAARRFDADQIVVETRNPAKGRRLELGSVAEQVLRSAPIPVLTVGAEAHLQEAVAGSPPVVLHATTLRETSRPGAALAARLAVRMGGRLIVLHVAADHGRGSHGGHRSHRVGSAAEAAAAMEQLRTELAALAAELPIEPRILHGNRLIEILATAAESQASLIVLGGGGLRAPAALTRDRATLQVLAHARCPVMTLPHPAQIPDVAPAPAAVAGEGRAG